MRYESLKDFRDKDFRRLTGVKRATFQKMAEILYEAEFNESIKGGPRHILRRLCSEGYEIRDFQ